MPAAAVIPAPIAYINIVAVKTLVVGFLVWRAHRRSCGIYRDTVGWCFPTILRGERLSSSLSLGRNPDLLL